MNYSRGHQVPCFFEQKMIDKSIIEKLVNEKIEGSDIFLVEVKVDTRNNIMVLVDSPAGLSIGQCADISRHIEGALDRDADDFALEVSSPGIGQPLKVLPQYTKTIDRPVEVLFTDGKKITGILKNANPTSITVEFEAKEKPEGAKRPHKVVKTEPFGFDVIKLVKETIIF
jgi:ribosome maturation factor RimP